LLARLWDNEGDVSAQALYSSIKRLRKKLDLEGRPSIFQNLYGKGYSLNPN
jgi:DNA-binding response OmpR family regulator